MTSSRVWRRATHVVLAAFGIFCIKQYANGGVCKSLARIDGKVVIVTGANAGIGKETAAELAKRGGKVYLACRSLERCKLAAEEIRNATGVSEDKLLVMHLDLGSLESVRSFVSEFKSKEKKLDILINNAGVMTYSCEQTADGFEKTFGTNHLGPFLLTNLLIDNLVAPGDKSRVVNVASTAHQRSRINFDDLMHEKKFHGYSAYGQSKLANLLFSRELSKRLGSSVSVYSLHPGIIRTNLFQELFGLSNYPFLEYLVNSLCWLIAKDPWYGAQTTVHCAVDEKLASETGKYYSDCAEKRPYPQALDDDAARRLWDASVQLVRLEESMIHPLLRR